MLKSIVMNIRKMRKADIKEWARMRLELWPGSLDVHICELEDYFSGLSIDIVYAVAVDIGEKSLAGFMELNIRNFAEGSRSPKLPYVEAWFIDEAYRGKGFGKQLMSFAEKWAVSQDFSELASDTEIGNKRSIKIHKALGFRETERIVCFLKDLK